MSDNTVTRAYLANVIRNKFGYSKEDSADLVDSVIEEIQKGLEKAGEVKISSLGTFRVYYKKERIGRNPKTKEEAIISARKVVSFHVSNSLRKRINNGTEGDDGK